MARTAQISKEKWQSIITLRREGQSIRTISRTLKVSSSAVEKTIKHYDETGSHEAHHRKVRTRVSSVAEDKCIRVTAPQTTAQINASQSLSNRHISTSTVQRRLRESGLHGWIAAKKPILKDTNNKKRLAFPHTSLHSRADKTRLSTSDGETTYTTAYVVPQLVS